VSGSDGGVLPATASVAVGVAASPEVLWPLVCDPAMPARFSDEVEAAAFLDAAIPALGAVIEGRNVNGEARWTTHSTVVVCDPPTTFSWATGGAEAPAATWTFTVRPADGGATLTHTVVLHEGREPLAGAIAAAPEQAAEIVDGRMAVLVANMQQTVDGIARLAEKG
jgi:hypothetical protein